MATRNKKDVIFEDLVKQIEIGAFTDLKLPSERKLALNYGVNRLTVREALKKLLEQKFIYKRQRSGNYVYDRNEWINNLKNRKFAWILINRNPADLIHSQLLTHLKKWNDEFQFQSDVITIKNHTEAKTLAHKIKTCAIKLDGIFLAGEVTAQIALILKAGGLPMVMHGHLAYSDISEKNIDRVIVNDQEYSRLATNYLFKKGCHNIWLINHGSGAYAENIKHGYMRALDEAHINFNPMLVTHTEGLSEPEILFRIKQRAIEKKFDAIFLANNLIFDHLTPIMKELPTIPLITVGNQNLIQGILHYDIVLDFESLVKEMLFIMSRRILFPHKSVEYYNYGDFFIIRR